MELSMVWTGGALMGLGAALLCRGSYEGVIALGIGFAIFYQGREAL